MRTLGRVRRTLVAAWRAGLSAWRGTPEKDAPDDGPAQDAGKESAQSADNPFAHRERQITGALTWLVGALGAVASVMLAGSQLSALGGLSPEDDPRRLAIAGASATAAIVLTLAAVAMLTWIKMPPALGNLDRLRDIGREPHGEAVLRAARTDTSYNRGTGGVVQLLDELGRVRSLYYGAKAELLAAELDAAAGGRPKDPAVVALRRKVELLGARNADLRVGAVLLAQLDAQLRLRRRTVRGGWVVVILALLAALGLVVFSWAANPPEPQAETDAITTRPVAARLLLASDDAVWADRLGDACAEQARADGIPVVALASTEDSVTVVTVPSAACPDPVRVVAPVDEATVVPDAGALGGG